MGKNKTIPPFVNHSMMLGWLLGTLSVNGVITADDWNAAVHALWNDEAR